MTSRERLAAALHRQPVDHIPFDPRIWHSFSEDDSFQRKTDLAKAAYLECDRMVKVPYDQDQYHLKTRNPRVEIVEVRTAHEHAITYHTADGDLVRREAYTHGSWHPVEYPVKSVEDARAMRHVYAWSEWWAEEQTMLELEGIIASYGDTALPVTGYVTSPYMELVERLVGLENLVYFLHDYPSDMEELMEVMHQDQLRKLKALLPRTSIKYIFSMENTTVDLVSPQLFRRYCVPHLTDYGKLIESFGKFHMLHMCGKIKQLLPDIDRIPALAIDAFSPPSVGNTAIRDGVVGCPTKVIIGGTNAVWWLEPEDRIVEMILHDIAEGGRTEGLVLQGPWEFAPRITPEKIRNVWRAVRAELVA
jgi:uroporphyrinogen-III decarboxylase